jgi:hypothetical protein
MTRRLTKDLNESLCSLNKLRGVDSALRRDVLELLEETEAGGGGEVEGVRQVAEGRERGLKRR